MAETTADRIVRAIREAKDLHAFVCGETRDSPATDNDAQRLRDYGIQRGYQAALDVAERAARTAPLDVEPPEYDRIERRGSVSCDLCRGEPEDAATRLHRVEDHRESPSSLKRGDVLALLARARADRAAVDRVQALADYFQFAVDSNEITAAWVTDIRNALAGDES